MGRSCRHRCSSDHSGLERYPLARPLQTDQVESGAGTCRHHGGRLKRPARPLTAELPESFLGAPRTDQVSSARERYDFPAWIAVRQLGRPRRTAAPGTHRRRAVPFVLPDRVAGCRLRRRAHERRDRAPPEFRPYRLADPCRPDAGLRLHAAASGRTASRRGAQRRNREPVRPHAAAVRQGASRVRQHHRRSAPAALPGRRQQGVPNAVTAGRGSAAARRPADRGHGRRGSSRPDRGCGRVPGLRGAACPPAPGRIHCPLP